MRLATFESREAKDLRAGFFEASRLAATLDAHPDLRPKSQEIGLGSGGIVDQLVTLTYTIFQPELGKQSNDQAVREWRERHEPTLIVAQATVSSRAQSEGVYLTMAQLEWLGDLLWQSAIRCPYLS